MTDRFLKIAITKPEIISSEADMISSLLVNGLDYVHIRKPEASLRDIRNLIEDIPYRLRKRLRLHGHFELFNDFNLGGAHLNSRCPVAPQAACRLSKSCHSIEELNGCEDYKYVTLSPIFDSISKAGYHSAFDINDLKDKISSKNVIALGGVTPEKFGQLAAAGFAGAAMLGCIWEDIGSFLQKINKTICCNI